MESNNEEKVQVVTTENEHIEPVKLWTLFKSTFMISAFTVGGGFVLIPLMKAKFVDEYHWISDKDSLNLVAIAQSSPGAVPASAAWCSRPVWNTTLPMLAPRANWSRRNTRANSALCTGPRKERPTPPMAMAR